jgi:hypothetical protein
MKLARGVEAKRHQIGLHVAEILEAMEHTAQPVAAGMHRDYGPLVRITGVTGTGRGVTLTVQADRLPLTLVDLSADVEAPLMGPVVGPVVDENDGVVDETDGEETDA